MENLNIAIVTDDKDYGKALGLAMLNVCRTLVINVFNKEEFETVQEKYSFPDGSGLVFDGVDIVLWDGTGSDNMVMGHIINLVEKPSMVRTNAGEGHHALYKFSPAPKIVSEVFNIYGTVTGRRPANILRKGTHVFAFVSCSGGTGCSTVAMAVAQELTRFHDMKVLYLSMEELESTSEFIRSNSGARTLGFYLYNLFKDRQMKGLMVREGGSPFSPFMESYVIQDDFGVEAFRPTKGRNPLVDISPEEISVFMESVMNTGRYDAIIVDAGCGLSPAAITCLEMAERISVIGASTVNLDRETHYVQYLMCIGGEDMSRKMIKIVNRVSNKSVMAFLDDIDMDRDSILDTSLVINEGTITANEGGIMKVLLEGEFGQKINSLTEMIVEPLKV